MEKKFEKLIASLSPDLYNTSILDVAHDRTHIERVLAMATIIAEKEGADLEIVIPSALFHDVIISRKDDPRSKYDSEKSAIFAKNVLEKLETYPKHKILNVMVCINECSYSKGLTASTLESKILQDADRLEATGAIAIMRTFSSGGQMQKPFYNSIDPFRENSTPADTDFSLDLFYKRLYLVYEGMHTKTAKTIARRRHEFLKIFEDELRLELGETGVWKMPPSDEEKRTAWYKRRHDSMN